MTFPSEVPKRRAAARRVTDLWRKLRDWLSALYHGVREGLTLMDHYERLSRLSDRDLANLGIKRHEIIDALLLTEGWVDKPRDARASAKNLVMGEEPTTRREYTRVQPTDERLQNTERHSSGAY